VTPKTLDEALGAEWLYTNGLGGYASSTLAGCNTRRYHGLLVAALEPPVRRTVMVSKLDETLFVGPIPFDLATNEFHDGTIHPAGHQYLARFERPFGIPTFTFSFQGWRLEKKVWMEQAENTTFVQYELQDAPAACQLQLRPLCAYRDFHAEQQAGAPFQVIEISDGIRVQAFAEAVTYALACDHPAGFEAGPDWWRRFLYREERERGLEPLEDLFTPGRFAVALVPRRPVLFRLTAEFSPAPFEGALERAEAFAAPCWALDAGPQKDEQERQAAELRFAATQFLVRRSSVDAPNPQRPEPAPAPRARRPASNEGRTVIAGYHWFGDWGRDTMIALPGLALCTGRAAIARDILRTFAKCVDEGMIPNCFGEQGGAEYNNVDGTLWFFQAVDRYVRAAEDGPFLRELFPTLEAIIDWHLKGTRYGIKIDPADGLLAAGQPGVQLTWMDAKVGDWVVTTRIGKPVEVNALWFNAICLMAAWARELNRQASDYQRLAAQIGKSFRERYWYEAGGYLYDVIDGPHGDDVSLRPNQVFAVSLPFAPIYGSQAKAVVDTVERELLTPVGLRSLARGDPNYAGAYSGDRWQRDRAYHQGTVWSWLIGPFVDAHLRVYHDKQRALQLIQPLLRHMREEAGIGTISEIFDGDEPHRPRGCIAQAWSVAEVLRVWDALHKEPPPKPLHSAEGNHGRY
jgi:glycogen debranching enzyme